MWVRLSSGVYLLLKEVMELFAHMSAMAVYRVSATPPHRFWAADWLL
jgi:hypothetical protein